MRIDVITIFPKMFSPVLNESIIKRAQKKKKLKVNIIDLRDFSGDKHRKVDDRPFGGGPGMVMRAAPFHAAVGRIFKKNPRKQAKVVLLCPQGKLLTQKKCQELAAARHLVLLCGHYEGIDQRVKKIVDAEVSIGDYVLTGGELPAMVLIDAVTRLIPGVLGHADSNKSETFEGGLLEYPHYTRPAVFKEMKVPEILLSGDHKKIAQWRKKEALKITKQKRPDLLKRD
jgi:tRNA (guanine37-N1)-methyltransferase